MFLIKKGIVPDKDLFGLKSLNKLVSLIGAHQGDEELFQILKKENLSEFYSNEQWDILHKKILLRYKDSLEKLHSLIIKVQNTTKDN